MDSLCHDAVFYGNTIGEGYIKNRASVRGFLIAYILKNELILYFDIVFPCEASVDLKDVEG